MLRMIPRILVVSGGSLTYQLAKQLCGLPVDAGPLQGLADTADSVDSADSTIRSADGIIADGNIMDI